MEYWQIINTILGLLGTAAIVIVKVMWARAESNAKAIESVHKALIDFRVEAAEKYVRYEVLGKLRDEIIAHLQRLEEKLDRKADR